jgi:hypothetical protein
VLHRIYDAGFPDAAGARDEPETANAFRYAGPKARFDHHVPDQRRGIFYAAETFDGAILQKLGGRRFVDAGAYHYAAVVLQRQLRMLDLRFEAAPSAGVSEHIGSAPVPVGQSWSKFFYSADPALDGIMYSLAGNRTGYVIYNRSFSTPRIGPPERDDPLSKPEIRANLFSWLQYFRDALGIDIILSVDETSGLDLLNEDDSRDD